VLKPMQRIVMHEIKNRPLSGQDVIQEIQRGYDLLAAFIGC